MHVTNKYLHNEFTPFIGKIAFSAGKDKKLITWNLVKARPAFITNLHVRLISERAINDKIEYQVFQGSIGANSYTIRGTESEII